MADMETLERCIEMIPGIMRQNRKGGNETGTRCVHCGMPLVDDVCTYCFPAKTMPSRDMLIRQAILNAVKQEIGYAVFRKLPVERHAQLIIDCLIIRSKWPDPEEMEKHCTLIPVIRTKFREELDKYGESKCQSF